MELILLGTGGGEPPHLTKYGPYRRRNSSAFVRYGDKGILIDNPPEICSQLLDASVRLSEVDYILFTHAHKDHFHPELIAAYKLGSYAILDDEFQSKPLYVFGGEDVIESYRVITERFRGGVNVSEEVSSWNYVISRGERRIYLRTLRPGDKVQLPYSSAEVIALPASHPSSSHYTEFRGEALGYVITTDRSSLLYMSDFGEFSDELWKILIEHRVKLSLVVLGCPVPVAELTETPHLDLQGILELFREMRERTLLSDDAKLVLTHLSPRWMLPEVRKLVERLQVEELILPESDGFSINL